MYDYRQLPDSQTYFGFPQFPPGPGPTPGPFPTPRPRELELRVLQLERTVQRQGEEIERLNRRLRRIERQLGIRLEDTQY